MRIDSQVEPLVREALAAVVARDPARSVVATQTLVDQGDQTFADAVDLCLAVDNHVLLDLYDGPPNLDSIASLADSVVHMEAWADIDRPTAQTFLTALVEQEDPALLLPPADAVEAGFVVGGWLLSAFVPESASWESALDHALDALGSDDWTAESLAVGAGGFAGTIRRVSPSR
ncbi:hypothetical protein GCM10022223_17400 [Kineosporia mesophila]|uniref:Uncharacterized protein n=1 Tax=Kineosporia mesophila TaxID=566012 RepID=A0ABP6ZEI3_9ACTN|nr:hypothetical protein [Kineosporia mesophila]MCD5352022.1 hypothetical protein [Kineosporia mesophila]